MKRLKAHTDSFFLVLSEAKQPKRSLCFCCHGRAPRSWWFASQFPPLVSRKWGRISQFHHLTVCLPCFYGNLTTFWWRCMARLLCYSVAIHQKLKWVEFSLSSRFYWSVVLSAQSIGCQAAASATRWHPRPLWGRCNRITHLTMHL